MCSVQTALSVDVSTECSVLPTFFPVHNLAADRVHSRHILYIYFVILLLSVYRENHETRRNGSKVMDKQPLGCA